MTGTMGTLAMLGGASQNNCPSRKWDGQTGERAFKHAVVGS